MKGKLRKSGSISPIRRPLQTNIMLLTNVGAQENVYHCPTTLTHRRIPSKSSNENTALNRRSQIEIVGTNESSLLHTMSSHNNSQ